MKATEGSAIPPYIGDGIRILQSKCHGLGPDKNMEDTVVPAAAQEVLCRLDPLAGAAMRCPPRCPWGCL
jgi:hypothetical protein